MSELRVGMMVRIVSTANPKLASLVGSVGVIRGASEQHPSSWYVDGADVSSDGNRCSWHSRRLIPINPDNEAFGSWGDMMNSLTTEKAE